MALISWGGSALADPLHEIETLLNNADYRKALEAIAHELKEPDLAPGTRAQLYWLKALCHVSDDQIGLAKSSLMNLLATNPAFEPSPNSSPKILNLFKAIAVKLKEQGGMEQSAKASFVPIDNLVSGDPYTFQVRLDEALLRKAVRLELHLRRLGNSEYSSLDFKQVDPSGLYEATVPPILTRHIEHEVTFEYYVDVIGEDGSRLGGLGRTTLPLTFQARPSVKDTASDSQAEQKKTFFTTAVIVGAAAAITIGGVIAAVLIFATPPEGKADLRIVISE